MRIDKDYEHGKYIESLSNTSIDKLEKFNLSNILYNDIWFSFNMTYLFIIKHILKRIFTEYLNVFKAKGNQEETLLFTYVYNRKDHDTYWELFKDIVGSYQEIEVSYSHGIAKINKKFIRDAYEFIKIFFALDDIKLIKSRIWLSLQVLNALKIKETLDKMEIQCKVLYTFFDGGFEGSIISQYFKLNGATTITLQHGQCLFRDSRKDRMNQSVILNFISDYCLCKGEFAKKQFVRAGIDKNRVIPLGNLECISRLEKEEIAVNPENKVVCVFLDTPSYSFYKQSTKELISIANSFSEKFGYKYFVKPHPADNNKIYPKYIDDKYCLDVLDKDYSLDEIGKMVEFSIFHASSIYADMLLRFMKSYKLQTDVKFDIILNKFDIFKNVVQLEEKVNAWKDLDVVEKENYFKEQNFLYSNPHNLRQRYKKFIDTIV